MTKHWEYMLNSLAAAWMCSKDKLMNPIASKKGEQMNPIERILQQMADDEVYEVTPLTGICKASALPQGYCGEAYYRDDPRLVIRLRELLEAGWSLPKR